MKINRNDPCWCGSGKKYKQCHLGLDEKVMLYSQKGFLVPSHSILKTQEQINGIRESGKVNIAVLDYVAEHIKAGITTEEIDQLVVSKTKELHGIAAPLGFEGYPKSVCTSVNDEVCHGIPDTKHVLKEGDIVNVDVSTIYNGYYSDSSRMFCIGQVSPERQALVDATKESISIGLAQVKPWNTLGDMGQAIHDFIRSKRYSVVREIGGHGVGLEFHEEPFVSYISRKGTEMLMVPGMVFTIEPMVNAGRADIVQDDENGWTIYTEDGSDSAQWEVTVAVTTEGYEILAY